MRWLVTSLLIMLACASTQAPAPVTAPAPDGSPAAGAPPTSPEAVAPPASGATADELREAPPPPPDPPPAGGQVDQGEGWTTPDQGRATPGYRIQIFASTEEVRAKEVAGEARSRLGEPVYIEFEAPLYKVRVGDCVTRGEADALKERAAQQGYDGAWVAETTVQAR
jgi:cell division septation protein DedD